MPLSLTSQSGMSDVGLPTHSPGEWIVSTTVLGSPLSRTSGPTVTCGSSDTGEMIAEQEEANEESRGR